MLSCADCGHKLHFNVNHPNNQIKYFNCSNYRGNRGLCNDTHYIRADALEQVMLLELRRMTAFLQDKEESFVNLLMDKSVKEAKSEAKRRERDIIFMTGRCRELDELFTKTYEDNESGKISDERFTKMSASYETEQAELAERVKALKSELDRETDKTMSTDMFVATVRKYTRAKKLTQRMLNELVDYIEVHHAEKIDGVHVQQLTIHYNCVGKIKIPNILPLPQPEVLIQTRKGVAVSYPNSQQVVNL